MRYDNIPPAIIRRAFSAWLKSQSISTSVLFRIPDVDDEPPFYLINWFADDQNPDQYWMRAENLMITCVDNNDGGIYGATSMVTIATDFFQREDAVADCNRFIEYINEGVPYRFKSFEIVSGSDEVNWLKDAMTLETQIFIRYYLTYDAETLPNIYKLSDGQLADLDT
jgi:hypothetical protein